MFSNVKLLILNSLTCAAQVNMTLKRLIRA